MSASPSLRIIRVQDHGDSRGSSFTVPSPSLDFLGSVRDMHVADILPGAVRGNHDHKLRREVVCVRYADLWSLYWDSGAGTAILTETFTGAGLVIVEIEPLVSHAVRNDGRFTIHMIGFSDAVFDSQHPDSYPREVVRTPLAE
jgi:hypothetical protein